MDAAAKKYAIRDGQGWKLIHGPEEGGSFAPNPRAWELYHLGRDPAEREDLLDQEAARLARMRERLLEIRASFEELGEDLGRLGEGEIDEETLEKLRRLGYLGDREP